MLQITCRLLLSLTLFYTNLWEKGKEEVDGDLELNRAETTLLGFPVQRKERTEWVMKKDYSAYESDPKLFNSH